MEVVLFILNNTVRLLVVYNSVHTVAVYTVAVYTVAVCGMWNLCRSCIIRNTNWSLTSASNVSALLDIWPTTSHCQWYCHLLLMLVVTGHIVPCLSIHCCYYCSNFLYHYSVVQLMFITVVVWGSLSSCLWWCTIDEMWFDLCHILHLIAFVTVIIFTVLHCLQRGLGDHKSVCQPVRLSVSP